jgi:hypothetical protein
MLQTSQRRRLRPFKEVTKQIGLDRQLRRLAEAMNVAEARNPKVDLNYFTLSVPMRLSDEDKMETLSELVDTVQAIESSDVLLLGIWVSPKA